MVLAYTLGSVNEGEVVCSSAEVGRGSAVTLTFARAFRHVVTYIFIVRECLKVNGLEKWGRSYFDLEIV